MDLETKDEVPKGEITTIYHGQALAEGTTTAMSKGLEPLPVAKKPKTSKPSIAVRVMASLMFG